LIILLIKNSFIVFPNSQGLGIKLLDRPLITWSGLENDGSWNLVEATKEEECVSCIDFNSNVSTTRTMHIEVD